MKYLINNRTGSIHRSTPLLLKMKRMVPAPDECAEMYEQFGIEAFKMHSLKSTGEVVFEPIIPNSWLHPEWAMPEEQEAARERLESIQAYIAGKQTDETATATLSMTGKVPNSAPVEMHNSRGNPAMPMVDVGEYKVPEDFNADINISTMSKSHLMGIARQIEGIAVHSGMKVKELRAAVQVALDEIRNPGSKPAPEPVPEPDQVRGDTPIPGNPAELAARRAAEEAAKAAAGPEVPDVPDVTDETQA